MPKRKTRSTEVEEEGNPAQKITEDQKTDVQDTKENIAHFTIPFGDKQIICEHHSITDTRSSSSPSLIFTHGAGGGITAPATRDFAVGFGSIFPATIFQGSLSLPNRVKRFHASIDHAGKKGSIALGGRSMGARAAVLTALDLETPAKALVLVSYPLMAGSKGDKREPEKREKILLDLSEESDVLFVAGDEDAMCDLVQLKELRDEMRAKTWLMEVKGASHGMELNGKAKASSKSIRMKTGEIAAEWLKARDESKRYLSLEWSHDKEKLVCSGWQVEGTAAEDSAPVRKKKKKKVQSHE